MNKRRAAEFGMETTTPVLLGVAADADASGVLGNGAILVTEILLGTLNWFD